MSAQGRPLHRVAPRHPSEARLLLSHSIPFWFLWFVLTICSSCTSHHLIPGLTWRPKPITFNMLSVLSQLSPAIKASVGITSLAGIESLAFETSLAWPNTLSLFSVNRLVPLNSVSFGSSSDSSSSQAEIGSPT